MKILFIIKCGFRKLGLIDNQSILIFVYFRTSTSEKCLNIIEIHTNVVCYRVFSFYYFLLCLYLFDCVYIINVQRKITRRYFGLSEFVLLRKRRLESRYAVKSFVYRLSAFVFEL